VYTAALVLALALGVSADGLHGGSHGGKRGGRAGRRNSGGRRSGRQDAPPPLNNYGAADGGALDSYAADDSLGSYAAGDPALDMLQSSIPGIPGEDYPIYAEAPETGFACDGQVDGGYYADPEAECQVFHICTADGLGGLGKYSFLCPNGTIFNQNYFICDWWFNFDCAEAEELYSRNDEIAGERAAADAAANAAGDLGSYGAPSSDYDDAAASPASYDAPAAYDAPAGRAARNGRQRNGRGGQRNGRRG
jgi:hypothetical protein